MRYDDDLAQGYPIASGVIEGACRHVVKDCLECTGMRWLNLPEPTRQPKSMMLDSLSANCVAQP